MEVSNFIYIYWKIATLICLIPSFRIFITRPFLYFYPGIKQGRQLRMVSSQHDSSVTTVGCGCSECAVFCFYILFLPPLFHACHLLSLWGYAPYICQGGFFSENFQNILLHFPSHGTWFFDFVIYRGVIWLYKCFVFKYVIHFFFLTEFLCDIEIKCFLLIVAAFMCWQKFCLCFLEAVWKSSIFLSPEVHCLKSVLTHIIFVLLWHTVLYCYIFILLFFSHHRFTVSRACANTYHFGTPKAHVYTVLYCYIFILLFFSHHRFTISRACANT